MFVIADFRIIFGERGKDFLPLRLPLRVGPLRFIGGDFGSGLVALPPSRKEDDRRQKVEIAESSDQFVRRNVLSSRIHLPSEDRPATSVSPTASPVWYHPAKMKKWFLRIAAGFLLLILLAVGTIFLSERDMQNVTTRVKNDARSAIKPDWPGNALDQKVRFVNDEFPYLPKTTDLLKWQLGENPFENEKLNDLKRLEVKDPTAFLAGAENGILWLGHASFLIRINGTSILTDPVFDTPMFSKRLTEVASPLDKIRDVNYVLISHDHRDHMDEATLRAVARKFPNAKLFAGLRSDDVLNEWRTPSNPIATAGWFQKFDTDESIGIYFLPVRHWSRRFLFDTNWRLGGGIVIQTSSTTIYFGGDSGYGRHYREARELFPNIGYFLIGIGAYEPRWFMKANHNSPGDAVQGFIDSGAKYLVPMHYGTFDLSDEPASRPLQTLLEEAEKSGIRDRVLPLVINEHLPIENLEKTTNEHI